MVELMRRELIYFFAALRFFTRIQVPAWVGHSQDQLDRASRYFPLVGLLVGAIGAGVTWAVMQVLPLSVALLLGMAATMRVTGAFHEDGFADSCDGFGGGWDTPQVLRIMKDSRIGSYGTVGMVILLLLKFFTLLELGLLAVPALLLGHAYSRAAAVTLIHRLAYVRDEDGKSKPLATHLHTSDLVMAWGWALLPLAVAILCGWPALKIAQAALLAAAAAWWMARYTQRRIGGYTGDVLGATQQLCEVCFYLGLLCVFI
jgi:adenosylcobinamide-GDP ribazoletransferase